MLRDVIEVVTQADGDFDDTINAHVTAYPISEDTVIVELEYVDVENDHEVIEVKSYRVTVAEA